MALGYAEKLSYKEDVGKVGMPELFDSDETIQCKIEELANLIKESKHLVAFTGAGISTSCGIPDFRGPKGVWTLQKEGRPLPKADLPFHQARPGITHMALVVLQRLGILKFVISQNVDGLHLKSGIPRSHLAELHGSSFREVCSSCGEEYIRDFEVETIGLKYTGRRCTKSNCRGKLKDTVLDWEDALPPKELLPAEKHCKEADVILCLGTSLQIRPACNLPLKSVREGGKMVIVNLQATPKDKKAALVIHARVDEVIYGAMNKISVSIPPFIRVDRVVVSWSLTSKSKNRPARWTLQISSSHGRKAPLPFIDSVEVSFPNRPDIKNAILKEQPFILNRSTVKFEDFNALLKLCFADGCMCNSVDIHHPLKFTVPTRILKKDEEHQRGIKKGPGQGRLSISSCNVKDEYEQDCGSAFDEDRLKTVLGNGQEEKNSMETNLKGNCDLKIDDKVDDLRSKAAKEDIVGTVLALEHNENPVEHTTETEYGIVTCIVRYRNTYTIDYSIHESQGLRRQCDEVGVDGGNRTKVKKAKPTCEKG